MVGFFIVKFLYLLYMFDKSHKNAKKFKVSKVESAAALIDTSIHFIQWFM